MISPFASRLGLILFSRRVLADYTKKWLSIDDQIDKAMGYLSRLTLSGY